VKLSNNMVASVILWSMNKVFFGEF
jgi:hypothetical protein